MKIIENDRGEIPHQLGRMMGDRTGIVNNVYRALLEKNNERSVITNPETANMATLFDASPGFELDISGKGTTLSDSLIRCFGETVERYCLSWPPDPSDLVYRSYDALDTEGRAVIDFEYLDAVTKPNEQFRRTDSVHWVEGSNWRTEREMYVPVNLVWFRTGRLKEYENPFVTTSNGAATGPSLRKAILGSIYEVVERDGLFRLWYTQATPPTLSISDAQIESLIATVEAGRGSIRLIELDPRVELPTVAAIFTSRRETEPAFAITGASSCSYRRAITAALTEVGQLVVYLKSLHSHYEVSDVDIDVADGFDNNLLYYSLPENTEHVEHLFEGPSKELSPSEIDSEPSNVLVHVAEELAQADCTPVLLDLTTEDTDRLGVHTTRAIVPELVPLFPPAVPPTSHPALADRIATTKPHPFG